VSRSGSLGTQLSKSAKKAFGSRLRLISRSKAILAVSPVQFVQQELKVGRWTRKLWAQVLLQPFAYGFANRPARPVVDLFVIVEDFAIHNEFRDQFAAC